MLRTRYVAALFAVLLSSAVTSTLVAQPLSAPPRGFRVGVSLPLSIGRSSWVPPARQRGAAGCDGSDVRAAESKRHTGTLLLIGGIGAGALGIPVILNAGGTTGTSDLLGLIGAGAAVTGLYLHNYSASLEAWDRALATFKVGETRPADVSLCLGKPSSITSDGTTETWSYMALKPGMFSGGRARVVAVTFKGGRLSNVTKTQTAM